MSTLTFVFKWAILFTFYLLLVLCRTEVVTLMNYLIEINHLCHIMLVHLDLLFSCYSRKKSDSNTVKTSFQEPKIFKQPVNGSYLNGIIQGHWFLNCS